MVVYRVGVNLWNDQRHVRILAESRAIIDNDAATLNGLFGKQLGLVATSAKDTHVEAFEALRRGFLNSPGLIAIRLFLARRTCGREQSEFRDGELTLVEETNDFLTDCTSRSEDAYVVCHLIF